MVKKGQLEEIAKEPELKELRKELNRFEVFCFRVKNRQLQCLTKDTKYGVAFNRALQKRAKEHDKKQSVKSK